MKSICRIVLLGAGLVLSLAGCQKGNTSDELTGKAVLFNASARSIRTRTIFTGDGTGSSTDEFGRKILSHERINWSIDDPVMIASDYATVFEGEMKYATYIVASMTESGDKSYATLDEKAETEELYFNKEHTSYKFWGIYPAMVGNGNDLVNAAASYDISGSQTPFGDPVTTTHTIDGKSVSLTTLAPDMTKAVMLGAAENQTAQKVELEFYPGFTAFEFTLSAQESEIALQKMDITTATGKSLAGHVAATIKTGGDSEFTCTYPSEKKVTYTFPANTVVSPSKYLTFTVFALPEDIEGLVLEFTMGDGNVTKATLKKKNSDEPLVFDGCDKHCLRGIALPGGWKFLYLDIDVMEWTEVPIIQSNGEGGVQATQFAVDGADNLRELKDATIPSTGLSDDEIKDLKNANKDYRQCWVFSPGQTVTVTYKIMMPTTTSGTWGIEKFGDTGDFTVSVTSSAGETSIYGNKYYGALSTGATYLTVTITSTASSLKTLYLKTNASDGSTTFSLDSETQLYDMRGYHYFIVNGSAATTFDNLNI